MLPELGAGQPAGTVAAAYATADHVVVRNGPCFRSALAGHGTRPAGLAAVLFPGCRGAETGPIKRGAVRGRIVGCPSFKVSFTGLEPPRLALPASSGRFACTGRSRARGARRAVCSVAGGGVRNRRLRHPRPPEHESSDQCQLPGTVAPCRCGPVPLACRRGPETRPQYGTGSAVLERRRTSTIVRCSYTRQGNTRPQPLAIIGLTMPHQRDNVSR